MTDDELRLLVAQSCKILYDQGQEHFHLGHVSARAPGTERVWVKPQGLGLGEIRPEDVMAIDLDGNQLTQGQPLHREMPIHTEIYRRRPDVNCVVHTHPFYASALAASGDRLRMLGQDSLLFADGIGRYDHPEFVVTREQGADVAEALGSHHAVLLRNHGVAAAGESVPHATYLALSLERAARTQLAMEPVADVREMSPEEVRAMTEYLEMSYHDALPNTWQYLLRQSGLADR